jgi:hypothetical protein
MSGDLWFEGKDMRTCALLAVLVLATGWTGGCLVIHSEKTSSPKSQSVEPEDVTIREIDAVGKLAFDNNRREAYKGIAGRPGLTDGAQVHLVEAALGCLAFEDAKVDVLRTLIHNPCFSPAAKAAVLERLDRLAFEDSRRKILDAISKNS